jgi:transposase-like protein
MARTEPTMPECPHCHKNDKVFGSALRGKKDFACIRCKKTFVKKPRTRK